MLEAQLRRARIVSSVAATVISLASGTNYVYSAWAPQFADRLHLTATQSNLIGLTGNLGMYTLGVPIGIWVDRRGPRPAVLFGAILLGLGYLPFRHAYDSASGSMLWLCLASYLTGLGGCMANAGAVKTSAVNWPRHRGTATAFPLAGFGLSAFFFSVLGSVFFPGDTADFLTVLAVGTFTLCFLGFFFLRVYPHSSSAAYHPVPAGATNPSPRSPLPSSEDFKHRPGRGVLLDHDHEPDIRGLRLLASLEFWQMFIIMGILAGIGLMTINNIGHNANALWKRWDDSISDSSLVQMQQFHVSVLSIGSFSGRLLSGMGSDFLVKKVHASRVWCLVVASFIFCIAQICALAIKNPHFLFLVSGLSGLGYGFLFGVFPSIVAEAFGIHGLSQNWGLMTLSPVVSGNVFNLFYGAVYDRHTVVGPNGELVCLDGLACYWTAYLVTLSACFAGLGVTLAVIRHQWIQRKIEEGKGSAED